MAIFGPKPWVNPFGKMSIFRLFELLVFIYYYFILFIYYFHNKDYTSITLYKDVARAPQKTTRLVRGGPLERHFFALEYRKRNFPGLYCLKKKWKKWSFLDQNHGLTPLKKRKIFRRFELLVFMAYKGAFSL